MTAGTRRRGTPRRSAPAATTPEPVQEQPVIAIETNEAFHAIWGQRQGASRSADDAAAHANRLATEAERQRADAIRQRTEAMNNRRKAEALVTEAERWETDATNNDQSAAKNDEGKEYYRQQEALHRAVARDLHNTVRHLAQSPAHKDLLNRLEEAEAQALANGTVGQSLTVPPTAGGDPLKTAPFTAVDALDARDGGI